MHSVSVNSVSVYTVPLIAYGTWVQDPIEAQNMRELVQKAIQIGYTHIDTARNYDSESYVFQAISEFPRESIFLTSKIDGYVSCETLRKELGDIQYYDLLLLHHPPSIPSYNEFKHEILQLWRQINECVNRGIAKAIGVSNFYPTQLNLLLEVCYEHNLMLPTINQIEIHPGNLELEYVPSMQSRNILPFAHTPLGGLASQYVLNNEILINIGKRIGATPSQVVLSYLLKRGIGVVTRSKDIKHMYDSIHAGNFSEMLTDEDMIAIDSTESGVGPMIESSQNAWDNDKRLR